MREIERERERSKEILLEEKESWLQNTQKINRTYDRTVP